MTLPGIQPTPFRLALVCLLSITLVSWSALAELVTQWQTNEAYGHGLVIVLVAVYLAIQRLARATADGYQPSLWFLPLLMLSLAVMLTAGYSELHVLVHYAIVGVGCSMVLAVLGWPGLKLLVAPLALLLLAIPIPGFLETNLTAELKLLSSEFGARLLQMMEVPAFNDGNIIDLGVLRLHVVDACSGLNYLAPLLAIGVMIAGFLNTSPWRRLTIVVLTIPLTIGMNVLRITLAGLLAKYVGAETASGFTHEFQGWMVFVLSVILLLPIAALLVRIGPEPTTLNRAFRVDLSLGGGNGGKWMDNPHARRNLIVASGLAAGALILSPILELRDKSHPYRTDFAAFPRLINDWHGSRSALDADSLMGLKLSDYLLARYRSPAHDEPVDIFASYYAEQTDGATPHSPNICLPAGGWEVISLERRIVDLGGNQTLPFNRALMRKDDEQLLVYYWYPQRGRLFANEILMKWFIFQDSILMNRSDGGFVRLTTPVTASVADANRRLEAFQRDIWDVMPRHIP